MSVISPLMNLVISTINVDSGLLWEQNLNSSLLTIDQHNHTAGSGAQIPTAGLNINSDLPLNSNNLTFARSVRFAVQSSPLSTGADLSCLYSSGAAGNLFFNDGAGNQIQITSGGNVNATSSGISSGTATASFVSSVLVVDAATNTPANIKCASILMGNNIAASNYLTLSPPSAMASSFDLTLPSVPVATSFMQIDTSGNMGTSVPVSAGITSINIAPGGVSRPNLVAVGQQISSSCGAFSTASTSFVNVTNLSVSITTSGRPVMLLLQDDGSGGPGTISAGVTASISVASTFVAFLRGGSIISATNVAIEGAASASLGIQSPSSSYSFFDTPAAGTYTYSVQIKCQISNNQAGIFDTVLVAYEL